jgi:hypothetical protein
MQYSKNCQNFTIDLKEKIRPIRSRYIRTRLAEKNECRTSWEKSDHVAEEAHFQGLLTSAESLGVLIILS